MPTPIPVQPPTPLLAALLLCDNAVMDRRTGRKSLLGLFDRLSGERFPLVIPCAIFAQFSDAQGRYTLEVRLVDRRTNQTVLSIPVPPRVEVPDRLKRCEILIDIPAFTLPAPGSYEVRLLANRQILGSTALDATLAGAVAPQQEAA